MVFFILIFSGLILTPAQVLFITVKIAFTLISHTAVHMYDFYIFTVIACWCDQQMLWQSHT